MYLRKVFPDAVPMLAAWSPDGSKIAIRAEDHRTLVYIVDRDGTVPRALVKSLPSRDLIPVASPETIDIDADPCFNRATVHEPEVNLGLVQDCLTLLDLTKELGGQSLEWSYDRHISEWEGIWIGGSDYRVVILDLRNSGLAGALPSEIKNLTGLRVLDLSHNNLGGTIPQGLGNLTNLQYFDLSHNPLSGGIPPELGKLNRLVSLYLSSAGLSGPTPPEMAGLVNLEYLYLGDNTKLSGCLSAELPETWLAESGLERCGADDSGIPHDLDLCSAGMLVPDPKANPGLVQDCRVLVEILNTNFEEYREVPWSIRAPITTWPDVVVDGSPLRVRELILSWRGLTSIHPRFGKLSKLRWLDLSYNPLTGLIPPELGSLTELEGLFLADNDLSGPIPPGLGNLTKLKVLYLSRTDLSGPIPPELAGLVSLEDISLDDTSLSGCIQAELSWKWLFAGLKLEHCNLAESGVPYDLEICSAGTLVPAPKANPGLAQDCKALVEILNGSFEAYREDGWSIRIPITLWSGVVVDGSPPRVRGVQISSGLVTYIPPELGKLSQLRLLELSLVRLAGGIPSELYDLVQLEKLDLSSNYVTGPIPPELARLVNLKSLDLRGNGFTGSIPPELYDLLQLETLDLAANNLSGPIPRNWPDWLT